MSKKMVQVLNKIDRSKRIRYIKFNNGFEVLIKYDKNFNKIESINSHGEHQLFNGNTTKTLTINDIERGRNIRGRRAAVDSSKEVTQYDNNGNIAYYFDGIDNWYRAMYDDNHNLLYIENSNNEAIGYEYDEDKKQWLETKSTIDVIDDALKNVLVEIKEYMMSYNIPEFYANGITNKILKEKGVLWFKWFICIVNVFDDIREELNIKHDTEKESNPTQKFDDKKDNDTIKEASLKAYKARLRDGLLDVDLSYTTEPINDISLDLLESVLTVAINAKMIMANIPKEVVYKHIANFYAADYSDNVESMTYDDISKLVIETQELCRNSTNWMVYESMISPTVDKVTYEYCKQYDMGTRKQFSSSETVKVAFNRIITKIVESLLINEN